MIAATGKIACFGEILLRLSPPGHRLIAQTQLLDLHIGGAEANVAVGLASLGHATRMISRLPDNVLGQAALMQLRGAGVDCSSVGTGPGRMGLYFLTPGLPPRPSEILYDRAGSSFALSSPGDFDWDAALDGVTWLHLSGIVPALGPGPADIALAAVRAAAERGIAVAFDCNHRAHLWRNWDGDPRAGLCEIIGLAHVLFGNHRDISLLLGQSFAGDTPAARAEAASACLAEFPSLSSIVASTRMIAGDGVHHLSVRVDRREEAVETASFPIAAIADRIGAGDAMAAGALHAMLSGESIEAIAQSGLALMCLKHTLPGDASLFSPAALDLFLRGERDVQR